jgi:hypothetical protein
MTVPPEETTMPLAPFTGQMTGREAHGDDWKRIRIAAWLLFTTRPSDRALAGWDVQLGQVW